MHQQDSSDARARSFPIQCGKAYSFALVANAKPKFLMPTVMGGVVTALTDSFQLVLLRPQVIGAGCRLTEV